MRITQEADNAIRILVCLARENRKMGGREIAETLDIPLRFSLKILRELQIAGFLRSYKGTKGGYILALHPDEITLAMIIETIDGPIELVRRIAQQEGGQADAGQYMLDATWKMINAQVLEYLNEYTLARLSGLGREHEKEPMGTLIPLKPGKIASSKGEYERGFSSTGY